ncbi:heme-thiolate peroxidase aromatic peroxygenase like [Pyrenophora seminiperda CCB06]|uniref:Heme-thiolate peroxidase aromatic peroxygenase like n=1 Tax=Pyrenophora seminiperda CCB06 TaxID=1302712 RepID=A0A3M7M4T4_9PLEO|nr:heme-thiolate peroxidase aromatic peroxygenase like [Pyrenophora seminiperda CCB06]
MHSGEPGVNSRLFRQARQAEKRQENCPFNPVHKGAAPYTAPYTYTGAQNGLPGNGMGGIKVPADGDTAHAYTPPGPSDIRGPCPGLNAAANHNFLSHDGITTFAELVDAQQNVYNVGYDLAVLLAVLGIEAGGDVVTGKLSIGCDATSRTALLPLLGRQRGLNDHNKFESDASLTRNDYFLANGDNYSFNGTLFANMKKVADRVSGGNFDRNTLAAYRAQRYDESLQQNSNFFFGPLSLLLYGASSFLYELFPSYGPEGTADLETMKYFFGAVEDSSAEGGWRHVPERIPPNWFSRRQSYFNVDVTAEILAQYVKYPRFFGGNVGKNNFAASSTPFDIIKNGKLPDTATRDLLCFFYQAATSNVPSMLSSVTDTAAALLDFALKKLNPVFKNTGCPLKAEGGGLLSGLLKE